MPDADTVWLTPLEELRDLLDGVGLVVRWRTIRARRTGHGASRCTTRSPPTRPPSPRRSGAQALDELLAAHRLWIDWLETGRVRKIAFVAERVGG